MNNSLTETDLTHLVQELNDEKARVLVPAIIYIVLLMVSGLIGNTMVCFYYGTKAAKVPTSVFIVTLAIYDLLACSMSMPTEIVDIVKIYTFENGTACKFLRFINYFVAIASATTLIAIAVDRYRHVCRATSNQMTLAGATKSCVVIAGVAVMLALPTFAVYDSVKVPVAYHLDLDLKGYDCTFLKTDSYKPYVWAYNIGFYVIFCVSFITLLIMYAKAVQTIYAHRKRLEAHRKTVGETKRETNLSFSDAAEDDRSTTEVKLTISSTEESNNDEVLDQTNTNQLDTIQLKNERKQDTEGKRSQQQRAKRTSAKSNTEMTRITFAMIVITAVFFLSFVPYLSMIIWRSAKDFHEGELSDAGLVGFKIGSRSFLLNSSINPWIYGICNPRFRQYYYKLLCSTFKRTNTT